MTVTLTDSFNRDDIRRVYASFAAEYKITAEWTGLHAPAFVDPDDRADHGDRRRSSTLQEVHLQLKTSAGAIRKACGLPRLDERVRLVVGPSRGHLLADTPATACN